MCALLRYTSEDNNTEEKTREKCKARMVHSASGERATTRVCVEEARTHARTEHMCAGLLLAPHLPK